MNLYRIPVKKFYEKNVTNLKQTHEHWLALVNSPGSQAIHRAHREAKDWPTLAPKMAKEARRLRNRARRVRQGRLAA